jgi:hypothetical protein
VVEGIRQSEGEDDEAFLLRAERVTEMERTRSRSVLGSFSPRRSTVSIRRERRTVRTASFGR